MDDRTDLTRWRWMRLQTVAFTVWSVVMIVWLVLGTIFGVVGELNRRHHSPSPAAIELAGP